MKRVVKEDSAYGVGYYVGYNGLAGRCPFLKKEMREDWEAGVSDGGYDKREENNEEQQG
jgi:ribosome modulation factor